MISDLRKKTSEFTACNYFLVSVWIIYLSEFCGQGNLWLASGWTTASLRTCIKLKGTFLMCYIYLLLLGL